MVLLVYDVVSLSEEFFTFRKVVVPPSSGSSVPVVFGRLTPKMKALPSFELSVTAYQATFNGSRRLNLQQLYLMNLQWLLYYHLILFRRGKKH